MNHLIIRIAERLYVGRRLKGRNLKNKTCIYWENASIICEPIIMIAQRLYAERYRKVIHSKMERITIERMLRIID